MAISLNHTIVVVRDAEKSAAFLAEILGLSPFKQVRHFSIVQIGETSLDFVSGDGGIEQRHFAFLASESEFDEIFLRIRKRNLNFWADPFHRRPGEINAFDDGRGVYFDDPDGHLLEIITRPYGSGGPHAKNPNPLFFACSIGR